MLVYTLTHSYSSHYSRKLPVSVLCVSVQRVMMFRTALKMDRCLHCRTDAQSLPPPYFQHHHAISDPFPFALDFLQHILPITAVSPNPFSSLSLPFQFSHFLTFLQHLPFFLRSSSDSIISSFHPVHLIFIMRHTSHDCSLSLLDPQKCLIIHPNSNLLYLP